MGNARRWYIYITSGISVHIITWAVISLLRNLFDRGIRSNLEFIAMQIAVIIIALPVFLVHWIWAQRLAREDESEKSALIRRIYLYVNMAATLAPSLVAIYTLFTGLLSEGAVVNSVVAVMGLSVVFIYHDRVLKEDVKDLLPSGVNATVRRIYVLGFSGVGLWLTTTAVLNLLGLVLQRANQSPMVITSNGSTTQEIVRLLIGVVLWLIFWKWAQQLFASSNEDEQNSRFRKFYLYMVVFISAISSVGAATLLLDGWISKIFGISSGSGGNGVNDAVRVIIANGVVWAYHAYVLRQDATASEAPRTATIRRLYLYLVATVGLVAFLVGMTGIVGVLFDAIGSQPVIGEGMKDQLAWSLAAIIAGLPVWVFPWRAVQGEANGDTEEAASNRRAKVRKNYLYIFLLAATLTLLGNLIYIIFQFLLLIFGERIGVNLINDLAESFAYALIAGGLLAFHGSVLRSDGILDKLKLVERLNELKVAVVDGGKGQFGQSLRQTLSIQFPKMNILPIGLTKEAAKTMGGKFDKKAVTKDLAEADLIVGPWNIASTGQSDSPSISEAVVASPAKKLLVPLRVAGWEWVGVEDWTNETMIAHTVGAVKRFLVAEKMKPSKPVGCVTIAGIVIGVFALFFLFVLISRVSF